MQTRRQFGKMMALLTAGGACGFAQKVDLTVRGVRLGAITGSLGPFNPVPEGRDVTGLTSRFPLL